jgi:hypothetical protein
MKLNEFEAKFGKVELVCSKTQLVISHHEINNDIFILVHTSKGEIQLTKDGCVKAVCLLCMPKMKSLFDRVAVDRVAARNKLVVHEYSRDTMFVPICDLTEDFLKTLSIFAS